MVPSFVRNLIPRRDTRAVNRRPLLKALRTITWVQWAQLLSGFIAWSCDSIDFFSVSLSVTRLQKQFHKAEASTITQAITLTLLFRSVGAVIFGVLSDRFGRKWPLVINLLFCAAFELGAGFATTFRGFLALRSFFGIAMGGVWGLATSTALENFPVEARGLGSGILQVGYPFGYLIAAVMNLYLVPHSPHTWRTLFWTSAGISAFAALIRALVPESEVFLREKALEREKGTTTGTKTRRFIHQASVMLKKHWLLCIYAVLLMAGFTFFSHGYQDLYPTYLQTTKGFDSYHSTVATIIGNCGGIAGGVIAGTVSQYVGRRLTIIIFVLLAGAFIPLLTLPNTFSGLSAGAFWLQFGVHGAFGVIPIQLAEMSPPGFRATFPGVTYQLGNMISSPSAQIEAAGGDHMKTTIVKDGKRTVVPDYARVQGILIGTVAAYILFLVIIGPENHGSNFEKQGTAFSEGASDLDPLDQHDEKLSETRLEDIKEKV